MTRSFSRRSFLGMSAAVSALALANCGAVLPKDEDFTGTINFSLPLGPGSQQDLGGEIFAERLAELTDGRLDVAFHYNNALGGEREVVEGMSINAIQMGMSSTGPMGGFVPSFVLFDMPYIFQDHDHAYRVLDGEVGQELADEFLDVTGVRILGWTENGFRFLTNSLRPVVEPADLDGFRHRTQESSAQLATWRAFGANAMPMAWPEVYTGLQQRVIHSQENPVATIVDMQFQQVQDYLSLTQHVYSPAPIMISERYFESFSEHDQQAILEAAEYATPRQREISIEQEEEGIEFLAEEGMEVNEIDREAFEEAAQPVIEAWKDRIPRNLIERVLEQADEGGAE